MTRKHTVSRLWQLWRCAIYIKSNNNVVGIKNQKGVSNNIVIDWVTEEGNTVTATIHFFKNPHMENGISLSVSNLPSKALGLCVNNYRPKLMKLPKPNFLCN